MVNAMAKRRIEFSAGRHCAHRAMVQIGRTPGPVLFGPDRAPIWPPGIVGSITHSAQYCAAVVASEDHFRSVGIDTELVNAVGPELACEVLRPDEISATNGNARSGEIDWPTLYFCIKEAAYKAFYPIYRKIIDFQDMHVAIRTESRTFNAEVRVPISPFSVTFQGKYGVSHGHIYVASWRCKEKSTHI